MSFVKETKTKQPAKNLRRNLHCNIFRQIKTEIQQLSALKNFVNSTKASRGACEINAIMHLSVFRQFDKIKKFRQINYLVISFVKTLLSRNFYKRVNFSNLHTHYTLAYHVIKLVSCGFMKSVKKSPFFLISSK